MKHHRYAPVISDFLVIVPALAASWLLNELGRHEPLSFAAGLLIGAWIWWYVSRREA